MNANRFSDLGVHEDEAHETLLAQLAKAHGSESRAADVVAQECLGGRFRYAPALGWLEWDGRRWDDDDEVGDKVADVVRTFIDQKERDYRVRYVESFGRAETIVEEILARIPEDSQTDAKGKAYSPAKLIEVHGDPDEIREYNEAAGEGATAKQQADIWLNLLSGAKIRSITTLCRGMSGIRTRTTDFDADKDLLNVQNGVLDLRTGELHPHDPSQLNTKIAGAAYDPTARSAVWEKGLEAVHPGVVSWFQIRAGQSLTGYIPDDDALVLSIGGGENGKSGVMSAIMRAVGSYGDLISHRVLISQPGQHPTELMDLRGLRFALLEETPEEGHLDTHQLKSTIGTPYIKARHMRMNSVTFPTTHTLFINTNFTPQVDTTDHGTWRRLKAMPWPYKFLAPGVTPRDENDRPGDRTLKRALEAAEDVPAAALAWLVEGAIQWYRLGQMPADPPAVVEAGGEWRATADAGFQFVAERLVADPESFVTGEDLKNEFLDFLAGQGKRAWSSQTINTRLPGSFQAAGIVTEADPRKPSKVREGEKQSKPPRRVDADGISWHGQAPREAPTLTPGKVARIWRGVRFRTPTEVGQPLARAV